jgi:hypothetical protein
MSMPASQLFDPTEFFSFASSILRDSSANEAALRSAISRAYYSAHLVARDRLFGADGVRLTARIRRKIKKSLQLRSHKKQRELGMHVLVVFAVQERANIVTLSQQLDQLREARVDADYKTNQKCLKDIGKQSWREYAEETMQLTALILPLLKRLPSY